MARRQRFRRCRRPRRAPGSRALSQDQRRSSKRRATCSSVSLPGSMFTNSSTLSPDDSGRTRYVPGSRRTGGGSRRCGRSGCARDARASPRGRGCRRAGAGSSRSRPARRRPLGRCPAGRDDAAGRRVVVPPRIAARNTCCVADSGPTMKGITGRSGPPTSLHRRMFPVKRPRSWDVPRSRTGLSGWTITALASRPTSVTRTPAARSSSSGYRAVPARSVRPSAMATTAAVRNHFPGFVKGLTSRKVTQNGAGGKISRASVSGRGLSPRGPDRVRLRPGGGGRSLSGLR